MNPANRDAWQPSQSSGPTTGSQSADPAVPQGGRALGGYGVIASGQTPQSAAQTAPGSGPVLPPPSGPFYSPNQSAGHTLPSLSGLTQSNQSPPSQPAQKAAPSSQDAGSAVTGHQNPPSGASYPLPSLNQTFQSPRQGSQPSNIERDRDARDPREKEIPGKHMEDIALREAQQRDRELHERRQQEQAAHENHAGSIQLHQPVAVAPQVRTIHGPNGLLGSSGPMSVGNPLAASVGVSAGQGPLYGSAPLPQNETTPRMQHSVQPPAQHLLGPFGGPGMPQAQLGLGQGQQPILNDALSYLDQVKVQFADHPDVYNRFLDIMKDFKSGAIDTPGVIDRVSSLFAGNPSLIQGFNTFLPPGYKIECGTAEDPNQIRVTTPMGTTVSSLPAHRPSSNPRAPINGSGPGPTERQFYDSAGRPTTGSWQQSAAPSSELVFSPGRTNTANIVLTAQSGQPGQPPLSPEQTVQREHQAAAVAGVGSLAHPQEQRGASQLQNATSTSAGVGPNRQNLLSPSGGAVQMASVPYNGVLHVQQAVANTIEKRGPVEFNHAISYVNKIKNRFSSQPDIYKQFLEILQTYQRESKPIQDVYAQVTNLFASAPDLLEDFKQFLPESAAQHRAAQAQAQRPPPEQDIPVSNVRTESGYVPQQTPRPDPQRLPPLGSFAATPAKDTNKRKRGERQGAVTGSSAIPPGAIADVRDSKERRDISQGGTFGKRPKQHHPVKEPRVPDGHSASPTLTPALPEALPPSTSLAATPEEMAFFDRVKKYIANKNQMNEFLKLCNLYAQDIIEPNLFVARAMVFIGGNPELAQWLKNFMGYEPQDRILDTKVSTVSSRVSLSNCRGLGPSYRLLPKRERLRRCSGRDDLCRSVLNDEWASHPTWASEDSGFVAHKKNVHEEGLHRIEEERHDYDLNIEACMRTVQQLEPIAQQLAQMTLEDRQSFILPKGLGGQSETIYKRVIMKIYGRETGRIVIENLFAEPYKVVPVLLGRLKQKLEEWKATQREWEKVWREQTQKIFWKSLDHQSASVKQTDKKQFQTKTLQNEIQVKYEEQNRQRAIQGVYTPEYQFQYSFEDIDVLYDASRLVLAYAKEGGYEPGRTVAFIKDFAVIFFRLDPNTFEQRMRSSGRASPVNDVDDETPSHEDGGFSPRSHKVNGKKSNLLRGVLDRGVSSSRGRRGKEESVASGSRASTPDIASGIEEDIPAPDSRNETPAPEIDISNKWMHHPVDGNERNLQPDDSYVRDTYNLYGNIQIYCMFRLFVILYERLCNLKKNEEQVHETVRRAMAPKPAIDLKLMDKLPTDFFSDVSPTANYYEQILGMFEAQLRSEDGQMSQVEEALRRYYLQNGWQLYAFDKLLNALVRFASSIREGDGADKAWDIYNLFKKDRAKPETTHNDELAYRKACERCIKSGDTYRICFNPNEMKATVQIFKKEELTFDPMGFTAEQKWRYYVASWTNYEPTEGVPVESVSLPYLKAHLVDLENVDDPETFFDVRKSESTLEARIVVNNYLLDFVKPSDDSPPTEEWFLRSDEQRTGGEDGIKEMKEQERHANEIAEEKLVKNNAWMRDAGLEEVQKRKAEYEEMKAEPSKKTKETDDQGDAVMANAE